MATHSGHLENPLSGLPSRPLLPNLPVASKWFVYSGYLDVAAEFTMGTGCRTQDTGVWTVYDRRNLSYGSTQQATQSAFVLPDSGAWVETGADISPAQRSDAPGGVS